MVQSVPLSHDQRIRRETDGVTTININVTRISFYCAAKLFSNNAGSLIMNKAKISISLNCTVPDDKTAVLCQLFNHFSEECKDFTKAISLKHQLQDYLFNQNSSSLTTDQAEHVHLILVGLQTTADVLDQYQFSQHNTHCPRLPAIQYKMMYHVQYNDTSLVEVIKTQGDSWIHDDYHIYRQNKPSPDCNQLFQ